MSPMIEDWVNLYPVSLLLAFIIFLILVELPNKSRFAAQALGALFLAVVLAHVNRWFHLWPAHLLCPSAHLTFCLGLSVSLAMLRSWTLALTLPLLVPFGALLLYQHYHSLFDLAGAFPLVFIVYGLVHLIGAKPTTSPPLDSGSDSP